MSLLPSAARKTLRPMRPKPLIPTLTAMFDFSLISNVDLPCCDEATIKSGALSGVLEKAFLPNS
jgi:hypothetical protein